MAGITRLNGSTQAGAFYGYQPRWFEVADTGYDIKDTGTVQTIQATIAYQFWRAGAGRVSPTTEVTSGRRF
jgi:hypothetical protein